MFERGGIKLCSEGEDVAVDHVLTPARAYTTVGTTLFLQKALQPGESVTQNSVLCSQG